MSTLDLSQYIGDNSVTFTWDGKDYTIPEPGFHEGKMLAFAIAAGGRMAEAIAQGPDAVEALLESGDLEAGDEALAKAWEGKSIEMVALGPVYDEMVADNVSARVIEVHGQWAAWYWRTGSVDTATSIVKAYHERSAGEALPKDRPASKSTPSTGSGSQSGTTKTGSPSTRTTGSRKKSPAKSATSKPKAGQ